ncbi:hypothetical protein FHG87_014661, partial [Trinorchestia longiramus]
IDKDQVLRERFDKVQTLQQKNVFLLVDEVQIRPTVSISGGFLSGMAENNRDCEATSILIIRTGPSVSLSTEQVPQCLSPQSRSLSVSLHRTGPSVSLSTEQVPQCLSPQDRSLSVSLHRTGPSVSLSTGQVPDNSKGC